MSWIVEILDAVPSDLGAAVYGVGILILAIVAVCARWFLVWACPAIDEFRDILGKWRRGNNYSETAVDVGSIVAQCRQPKTKVPDEALRALLLKWRCDSVTEIDARIAQASATSTGLVRGAIIVAAGLVAMGVVIR